MMQLIEYMREYNDDAEEEEQLNFYGFDMQRIRYSFDALKKECIAEGVDLSFLDNFIIAIPDRMITIYNTIYFHTTRYNLVWICF